MRHLLWALLVLCWHITAQSETLPLERVRLPPGFQIELLARVPNARQMALGDGNTLFVGTRNAGKVFALPLDRNFDAGKRHVIAKGLNLPVGVAYKDGSLYVSAVSRILRFDNIEKRLTNPPEPIVITDKLPQDRSHGWKFIGFGPDGWLYVPVGAPCNICKSKSEIFATILRMKPDGSQIEIFAHGIRNTVGFDWHPVTGELWFTDNGRDWMGENLPPDELNHAAKAGMHFGYPYCHGTDIPDPSFGKQRSCAEFTPPMQNLGPHVAALGMRFYTGEQFPKQYRNQIFIAEHGSWNRINKIGYRITVVTLEDGKTTSYKPFATGWLSEFFAWGRPADVLILPDGSLLISDDFVGAIYRVRYNKKKNGN